MWRLFSKLAENYILNQTCQVFFFFFLSWPFILRKASKFLLVAILEDLFYRNKYTIQASYIQKEIFGDIKILSLSRSSMTFSFWLNHVLNTWINKCKRLYAPLQPCSSETNCLHYNLAPQLRHLHNDFTNLIFH